MPLRRSNQAVAPDPPSLKAVNPDSVPRASRPNVRAEQSPVILGFSVLEAKLIHNHAKIRKGIHERLCHFGDCAPSNRKRAIVDAQRPLIGVEGSNALRILAAPCRRVALCEISKLGRVVKHRNRVYQIAKMRLNPDAPANTNPMHLLKCWIAGLAFSLIVVAGDIFALHTPFGFLAILFGIPVFILNAIATGSHRYADSVVYALLTFFGGIFYGLLFYLISVLIRRITNNTPNAKRN